MNKYLIVLFLISSQIFAAGAKKNQQSFLLQSEFELTKDEMKINKETNTSLKWTTILQDNRCPADVTCIVAGDVTLAIEVNELQGEISTEKPYSFEHQQKNYILELVDFIPKPVMVKKSKNKDITPTAIFKMSIAPN